MKLNADSNSTLFRVRELYNKTKKHLLQVFFGIVSEAPNILKNIYKKSAPENHVTSEEIVCCCKLSKNSYRALLI